VNTLNAPALIVAYDGSAEARRALDHAAALAGPGGEVTVINVVPAQAVSARLEPLDDAKRARQRARLEEARALLDRQGLRVRTVAAAGDPFYEISALARDRGQAIVIVGRRRHLLPGRSLTTRLVRSAPYDVLVVG
jgi:nucleotide-binding universal stress UspA family protein